MTKETLKAGNAVVLRKDMCSCICVVTSRGEFCDVISGAMETSKDFYTDNFDSTIDKKYDIMEVYKDYTLKKILWKRKEKTKLTHDEKVILRNLDLVKYKYIARDRWGDLFLFEVSPYKSENSWYVSSLCSLNFNCFRHLFEDIKWIDSQPTLIADVIQEEKEEEPQK